MTRRSNGKDPCYSNERCQQQVYARLRSRDDEQMTIVTDALLILDYFFTYSGVESSVGVALAYLPPFTYTHHQCTSSQRIFLRETWHTSLATKNKSVQTPEQKKLRVKLPWSSTQIGCDPPHGFVEQGWVRFSHVRPVNSAGHWHLQRADDGDGRSCCWL